MSDKPSQVLHSVQTVTLGNVDNNSKVLAFEILVC